MPMSFQAPAWLTVTEPAVIVSVSAAVDAVPVASIGLDVLIPLKVWRTTCKYTEPDIAKVQEESPGWMTR